MGGKRGRTQRKHFKKSRENVWNDDRSDKPSTGNTSWEPFATKNLDFEEYYKVQGIVSQEEWDVFMETLRKPLPASFRINSSGQFFKDIRLQLENDFMKSFEAEAPDGESEPIRPLPWYPENLAWHSNFSRMQLRKNQTLERFHEFLKQENEIGNITRQEAVSMVPPLFLDVHPQHFVLDMCAAPGSKTFQLLEIIHQSTEPGLLPDGMVIANDADTQRCNLLIHQTKRMCSANLMVTNHEAQHFPGCHLNKTSSDIPETESFKDPMISQLLFDSVLCDVPCSGDGTLRKAPDIWRKNAGLGNGVHRLQVQIAMRGIQLLKVGGRMVYSTCSMNPVENEAVVAEILRRCGESVELLDVSTELPQLVRRPGLKKWKVKDRGIWLVSYKDVPRYRRSAIVQSMFPSGRDSDAGDALSNELQDVEPHEDLDMGNSPSSGKRLKNGSDIDCGEGMGQLENIVPTVISDDEVCSLPLERCMRIVPHDQNTGAFFIAVFHKCSPLKVNLEDKGQLTSGDMELPKKVADKLIEETDELEINPSSVGGPLNSEVASDADLPEKQPEECALESDPAEMPQEKEPEEFHDHGDGESNLECSKNMKRKLQIQGKWRGVDPVVFFRDETIISSIKAFYGINESFPLDGHLVARNLDTHHVKRIYYISKSVQDVLKLNFEVGQRLKIASVGLKTFERQTSREGQSTECSFRISSEGLPLLLPYITKQILSISLVDLKHLLQYKTIKFADFVDAEFGDKASNLKLGCCIFVLRKESESASDPIQVDATTIAIGCWKGKSNISVMVSAVDCQQLLQKLSFQSENERGSSAQENKHPSSEVNGRGPTDDVDVNQEPGTIE